MPPKARATGAELGELGQKKKKKGKEIIAFAATRVDRERIQSEANDITYYVESKKSDANGLLYL